MSCTSIDASDKKVGLERSYDGLSLIATRDILLGEAVLHLTGQPVATPSRYSVQIDEDMHLEGPPESMSNYINHSCDPSCFIDWPSLNFVALRHIHHGEAITYHYCTSEWYMKEKFECRCGAPGCLGIIKGAKYLNPEEIKAIRPYLAPFLLRKISILNQNGKDDCIDKPDAWASALPHHSEQGLTQVNRETTIQVHCPKKGIS